MSTVAQARRHAESLRSQIDDLSCQLSEAEAEVENRLARNGLTADWRATDHADINGVDERYEWEADHAA